MPPPPCLVKIGKKKAAECGGLYFMFLGPLSEVSGSATDVVIQLIRPKKIILHICHFKNINFDQKTSLYYQLSYS